MLIADHLAFHYPASTEVYDFSFAVAPGRILGVSGKSGSGKSTLLDLIAGFQMALSGSLRLEEDELASLAPDKRPVSILFQSDNLFDHLSVKQNLALAIQPGPEQETNIDAALEEVGLLPFRNQRASDISGGQKQRVALARTLLLDRPILLLDEPFTALDAQTAAEMRQLVRSTVTKRNWHALLVSHQPADLEIADHRCQLSGGRLEPEIG